MLSTYRRAHDNAFCSAPHRAARAMAAAFKQLYGYAAAHAPDSTQARCWSRGDSQALPNYCRVSYQGPERSSANLYSPPLRCG